MRHKLLSWRKNFPIRILQEKQAFVLRWDISLRAPARRMVVPKGVWLREEDIFSVPNSRVTTTANVGIKERFSKPHPYNFDDNLQRDMVDNMGINGKLADVQFPSSQKKVIIGLNADPILSRNQGSLYTDFDEEMGVLIRRLTNRVDGWA
ncbi:hypothetical protein GOBAR_DD03519 [Gossypium barbadense]|nr:hypothetical protein GOBAR_DD03519 [Gossypium barbadense]